MTKFILGGGYLFKAPDGGRAFVLELTKGIKKPKILDCVFADPENETNKFLQDKERFAKFISDFEMELATPEKFVQQIKSCNVLFIRGGDTEILIDTLKKSGDWISALDGKTVAGTSAGAMAIAKYSHALVQDKIIEGFGILLVKVIAHWQSEIYEINWEKAKTELQNYKEDLPVYALKEGEFVTIKI